MAEKRNRKQVPINFNLDDPRQVEMLKWYESRTNNVSGYMKEVLFMYMELTKMLEQGELLSKKYRELQQAVRPEGQ